MKRRLTKLDKQVGSNIVYTILANYLPEERTKNMNILFKKSHKFCIGMSRVRAQELKDAWKVIIERHKPLKIEGMALILEAYDRFELDLVSKQVKEKLEGYFISDDKVKAEHEQASKTVVKELMNELNIYYEDNSSKLKSIKSQVENTLILEGKI